MSTPVDFQALMLHQARWLGMEIDPAHQPGVVLYLQLASRIAEAVMQHPLTPADEPANVFTPVEPLL